MASNMVMQRQEASGWTAGLSNLFRKETRDWFGTRTWLVQALIWLAIVNGMVGLVLFSPKPPDMQAQSVDMTGLMIFFIFAYMAMGIGTVIQAQDEIIGEKQSGTAAWILSKPVSRTAFLLSKLIANALGMLVVMVLLQGAVAFALISFYRGSLLSPTGMLAALGILFIDLIFFLCLTLILGTLFDKRGAVIGIPMAILLGYQFILGLLPSIKDFSPYPLLIPLGQSVTQSQSVAMALVTGTAIPSFTPVIATIIWSILFAGVAVWRFSREEF